MSTGRLVCTRLYGSSQRFLAYFRLTIILYTQKSSINPVRRTSLSLFCKHLLLNQQIARGTCPLIHPNYFQGCSLGLERLGLETVSRPFFGTSRLVSVLKVERLGLVSVSRVWKNRTSRSRLGFEGSTSRSRLGLEDITSRSRSPCDTAFLIRFLERLGLETFFGTSRLVSVLKVERLGLVSVS